MQAKHTVAPAAAQPHTAKSPPCHTARSAALLVQTMHAGAEGAARAVGADAATAVSKLSSAPSIVKLVVWVGVVARMRYRRAGKSWCAVVTLGAIIVITRYTVFAL